MRVSGIAIVLFLLLAASCTMGSYRCQKPLSRVVFHAKTNTEQCDFHYFSVADGVAEVKCSDSETCNASLSFDIVVSHDMEKKLWAATGTSAGFEGNDSTTELLDDIWRFDVALKSFSNKTTVHYKGDDGYSVCCDLLGGDRCEWVSRDQNSTPSQQIRRCELPQHGDYREGEKEERRVKVHLSKPLHQVTQGKWEARVTFWRRRQARSASMDDAEELGRLIVPFEVTEDSVSRATPGKLEVALSEEVEEL